MNLFSFGIVRGLVGQVLGTIAGFATIAVIRLIFGIRPVWNGEASLFLGGLFGVILFLYGIGILDDWIKVGAGHLHT